MTRKKVLIIEAASILGSHLCNCFKNEGYLAFAISNLVTGKLLNLEHLLDLENIGFYNPDESKFMYVPGKLDYILHFASLASPIAYLTVPIQPQRLQGREPTVPELNVSRLPLNT